MKKILVIEDQPQMRRNLVTILEMEGFEPLSAENGRAGLEMALRDLPDLILCDVTMPELDGHGVLEALRANHKTATIPFIFLTARGEKEDLRAGMNRGADDYLAKPVARQELLDAVQARLVRRKVQQAEIDAVLAVAGGFKPNFDSPLPLQSLGLTPREAEVLLWVAQGKSNGDIAVICGMAEKTVKKHLSHIFEKLGLENRNAATMRALEILSAPSGKMKPVGSRSR